MATHGIEIGQDGERKTFNLTASLEANLEEAISADQVDTQYFLAIDVSALKAIYIECSETALTIETNSGSTPADTFTVVAGKPIFWHVDSGLANPFTSGTDVTSIFVTENSSTAGTLKIKTLQDGSP